MFIILLAAIHLSLSVLTFRNPRTDPLGSPHLPSSQCPASLSPAPLHSLLLWLWGTWCHWHPWFSLVLSQAPAFPPASCSAALTWSSWSLQVVSGCGGSWWPLVMVCRWLRIPGKGWVWGSEVCLESVTPGSWPFTSGAYSPTLGFPVWQMEYGFECHS